MSDEKRGKTRKKDHLQSETYLGNKVWRTAGSLENVCMCSAIEWERSFVPCVLNCSC